MTLLELREQLVRASGRTDLVVDTQAFANDGADFYIRSGQRYLDDKLPTQKSKAEVSRTLSVGDSTVSFPRVRSILKVRIQETGNSEKPDLLEEYPLHEFYDHFGDKEYIQAEADQGKPKRYALGILRDDSPLAVEESEHQILFHPPSDDSYDLVITAGYFSAELRNDTDESFWSIVYPDVLIMAARRRLEIEHRNRQGAEEFERHIRQKLQDVDSNLVKQDSSGKDQMNDAWRRDTGYISRGEESW